MLIFDESKPFDMVALGRAGIDLNPVDVNVPMEDNMTFRKTVGGSPANIAVACSRYGLKVGFIGRVSDDQHGRYIRTYFKLKGINTDNLVIDKDGGMNGLAFTEIRSPQDSSFILHRDNVADLNLSIDDIDEEYIKQSKLLLVSGTALARSPSREAVFAAINFATKHNTKIMLDIDYRDYSWKSVKESGIYLSLVAEKSHIIIGTREEFNTLESFSNPVNRDDFESAKNCFNYSTLLVIIKHGREGAIAYSSEKEVVKGEVFPVIPLKTMGAGDSFAGGFIYGILKKLGIKKSMEIGAGAAAIVVQKPDCSESMPSLKEVLEFIRTYKEKFQ